MKIEKLFPTLLGMFNFNKHSENRNKYIDRCVSSMSAFDKGGDNWVAKDTYNTSGTYNFFKDECFKDLTNFIKQSAMQYCDGIGADRSRINFDTEDAWFNFYKKYDFQDYHIHPSVLSVVYFLKVSESHESAKIFFKSPINARSQLTFNHYNQDTFRNIWFNPPEGTLLIFDSTLEHCVSRHNTDDPRITMSANFYLK